MVKVEDMTGEEMRGLLRAGFGHLGCTRDNRPYVAPMHYAYEGEGELYFITTEGTKTDYIDHNPLVCLQVEDVRDAADWRSVMVTGRAERLTESGEMERALQAVTRRNPTLTPAVRLTQLDAWGRANIVALYRLRPEVMDGRKTAR